MLFNIENLSRTLLTHFEPLYTNMCHKGPLNGTTSYYTLGLKIYVGTSTQCILQLFKNYIFKLN